MKNLKKLAYIFDKKEKLMILLLGVMIFIGGILETFSVSALFPVVAVILDADAIMTNKYVMILLKYIPIQDTRELTIALLGLMMFLFVLKNAYALLQINVQTKFITTTRNKLISRVLREFLNRPYEFYLDADIPTVFRLTDSDIPNVFGMVMAIISLISEGIVFSLLSIFLIASDWKMTLFLIVIFCLLTLLLVKVMRPRLAKLGKTNQSVQSRIAKWRIEAIYGIKDVKVLHREAFFADNYENTGKKGAIISKNYSVLNNMPRLLIETVFMCAIIGYLIVYTIIGNDVSKLLPTLTVFGLAAIRMMPSVNRINTYLTDISYYQSSLDYVYENLNMNALMESESKTSHAINPDVVLDLKKEISLEHIEYAYPNTDKKIFDDAMMKIPYGKSVGIMGPSGAGKSTIVDILLGLLRAQKGKITCDGIDIYENYPSWLAQIGYIPQSIYLVDEPIRNNIAFGIADEEIDDERIWQVLEDAQMKEFVKEFPEGLDTTIGDRGVRLSGGQRQRLGIARALYHNPEILVFDEATSALDNETEQAVMEAINSFQGKKTMVIIAHRLNTIANCDIIYKVENGKITETTLS